MENRGANPEYTYVDKWYRNSLPWKYTDEEDGSYRGINLCERHEFIEYITNKCNAVPELCTLTKEAWVLYNNQTEGEADNAPNNIAWKKTKIPDLTTFSTTPHGYRNPNMQGGWRPESSMAYVNQAKKYIDIWMTSNKKNVMSSLNKSTLFHFDQSPYVINETSKDSTNQNRLYKYMYDRRDGFNWLGLNITSKIENENTVGKTIVELIRNGQTYQKNSPEFGNWRQVTCNVDERYTRGARDVDSVLNDQYGTDILFNPHKCTSDAMELPDTMPGDMKGDDAFLKFWKENAAIEEESCPSKKQYLDLFPDIGLHIETAQLNAANSNNLEIDYTMYAPLVAGASFVEYQWYVQN